MKFEDYQLLKKDDMFRRKTTQVCELCYLDIIKYSEMLVEKNTKKISLSTVSRPIVNNSSKIELWNQTINLKKVNIKKSNELSNKYINNYLRSTQNKFSTKKMDNKKYFLKSTLKSPALNKKAKDNVSIVSDLPDIPHKRNKSDSHEKEEILFFTEDINKSTKENDR